MQKATVGHSRVKLQADREAGLEESGHDHQQPRHVMPSHAS
jgi:hypothetical protein